MNQKQKNTIVFGLALFFAVTAYFFLRQPSVTEAACGSGTNIPYTDITAYAMGNLYSYPSGQQHLIVIGDAAAHYYRWPWGTCIKLPNKTVTIPTANGGSTTRSTFYIWDSGDGTSDPDWVDIYFGRYRRYGQSCICPGVPSGSCTDNTVTNSCDAATNFGFKSWTIRPDNP